MAKCQFEEMESYSYTETELVVTQPDFLTPKGILFSFFLTAEWP